MISLHKKTEKWKEEVLEKGTMMHIYFKELGVVKYQRDELYGAMDVIGESTQEKTNIRLSSDIANQA